MAKLTIGDHTVEVDDAFLTLGKADQEKAVSQIAAQLTGDPSASAISNAKYDRNDPRFAAGPTTAGSALRGVPILGAGVNRLSAAASAVAHPLTGVGSEGGSFSDRYAKNLEQENAAQADYEREHPIADTVNKLVGGTVATAPLAAYAPVARVMGMSGTLPQMVVRGGASNAVVGGIDEALRGGDPTQGAEAAGIAGAALPVAGRAVGSAIRALRPGIRPNPGIDIAGVRVPQFESQLTGDNAAGTTEQMARAGTLGEPAQRVGQQAFDERDQALRQAQGAIGEQLNPGQQLGPHDAGNQVITELAQQHNDQVAAQAREAAGAAAEGTNLRTSLNAPTGPQVTTPDSRTMGEALQMMIQHRAQQARAARTAAYEAAGNTPGEYSPAAWSRVSDSLRQRLNSGPPEARVRVNDNTARTAEGLELIERELGSGRTPTNLTERGTMQIGPDGRPIPRPITGRDVEAVRQMLIPLQRDANAAARAPGGSAADARGMRALIDAFDAHVRDVIRAGGFSGDGAELLRRYDTARQLHSQYRQLYSNRGQGDIVGPTIESIIGKHPGQEMTPETIAQALYGSPGAPGGNKQVALAQRVRQIVGEDSPMWTGVRQGVLSHMLDTPAGTAALDPRQQADRIYRFVDSTLSQTLFTPAERAAMRAHADRLGNLVPHDQPMTAIDRQMARLAGADGYAPPTSRQAVDMIFPGNGAKANPQLLERLRDTLTPDSWNGIRQAMWQHLTTTPEGVRDFGVDMMAKRLGQFLNEPAARTLYSEPELQLMRMIRDQWANQRPLEGTTNPSGSGIWLSKVANVAKNNLMRMIGLATHGPAGFATGYALDKALEFASTRRAANRARDVFYGKPVKGAVNPNYERAAAILSHAASPLVGAQ